jgi:RNA polymerase sigma-70 factor, ECF subfamily
MPDISAAPLNVPTCFDAAILPFRRDVYRFALSLCRDRVEADDVLQDTFMRARRSWRTFQPGTDRRRWLFTICRNAFLRRVERRRREVSLSALEVVSGARGVPAPVESSPQPTPSPADAVATADVARAIRRALANLPAPFRNAVQLVDVEEYSYEETAHRLGVPVGTVRSRVHRGRRLLRGPLTSHAEDLGLTA